MTKEDCARVGDALKERYEAGQGTEPELAWKSSYYYLVVENYDGFQEMLGRIENQTDKRYAGLFKTMLRIGNQHKYSNPIERPETVRKIAEDKTFQWLLGEIAKRVETGGWITVDRLSPGMAAILKPAEKAISEHIRNQDKKIPTALAIAIAEYACAYPRELLSALETEKEQV